MTNEEAYRTCRVDVDAIAFNHVSNLRTSSYYQHQQQGTNCHCKLDLSHLKGKLIRI